MEDNLQEICALKCKRTSCVYRFRYFAANENGINWMECESCMCDVPYQLSTNWVVYAFISSLLVL